MGEKIFSFMNRFPSRIFFVKVWIFSEVIFLRMNLWSVELDSPAIKTLERHFFTLSECLSNVLISRDSNFDEKNGQEMFNWSEVHSWNNNFLKNPLFSIKVENQKNGVHNCYIILKVNITIVGLVFLISNFFLTKLFREKNRCMVILIMSLVM